MRPFPELHASGGALATDATSVAGEIDNTSGAIDVLSKDCLRASAAGRQRRGGRSLFC